MAVSRAHEVDTDPDPDSDPDSVASCVALRWDSFPYAQLDSFVKITATLVV